MRATSFWALVDREWKTWWNSGSGYALRGLYGGLLLAGLAASWVLAVAFHWLAPSEYPELVRVMFATFVLGQLILATVLSTVSFARSLVREKERRSIDLLILSPLPGSLILLAKTVGSYLGILALLAAGLPVLCFLEFLGGVSLGQVLASQLLIAGQLAIAGGVSALFAAVFVSQQTVMLGTWVIVLGSMFMPGLVRWFFPTAPGGAGWVLDETSFWVRLSREVGLVDSGVGGAFEALGVAWGVMAGLCLIGGVLFEGRQATLSERVTGGLWKRFKAPFARTASSRLLTPLFRPLLPIRHPLARRECALGRDTGFRLAWLVFGGLITGGASLLALRRSKFTVELHVGLATLGVLVALFLSILGGAVGVVSDRRKGVFEELLAANVDPEDIVRAKLAGLFLRGGYLLSLPAAYAWILAMLFEPSWSLVERLVLGGIGLALGTGTALVITLAVSVRFRSSAAAAAFSLFLALPAGAAASLMVGTSWIGLAVGGPVVISALLGLYAFTVHRFRRVALV